MKLIKKTSPMPSPWAASFIFPSLALASSLITWHSEVNALLKYHALDCDYVGLFSGSGNIQSQQFCCGARLVWQSPHLQRAQQCGPASRMWKLGSRCIFWEMEGSEMTMVCIGWTLHILHSSTLLHEDLVQVKLLGSEMNCLLVDGLSMMKQC